MATLEVGDRTVRITTPERVLWPQAGVTKADLVRYYVAVAPVLLPHLRDRPLTLHRFPEGVDGVHFFQTRCPPHPEWVRTQRMYTFRRSGKEVDAPVVDDLPSLVWAANLSAVELHPFLSTSADLDRPTAVVFDLDPGPPAGLPDACRVALELRAVLDALGLVAVAKTSGVKGMHVYVPLNVDHTFDDTKAFARAVAELLARRMPERVVSQMTRSVRAGRTFVDWSQNDPGKSTVVAYSLRGTAAPGVSTPVTWEEVEAASGGDVRPPAFDPRGVLDRIDRLGDLFAPVLEVEQSLGAVTDVARSQPVPSPSMASAARRPISSGGTSST